MSIKALKYTSVLSVPLCAWVAFHYEGIWSFLPIIYAFFFVPLIELAIPPQAQNLSKTEEELRKEDKIYDWMLYLILPMHLYFFYLFLQVSTAGGVDLVTTIGRVLSMGLLFGLFGINVAHELGHRTSSFEKFLSKTLLWTTQYTHFFIEHNEGHHKNVGTPDDPASADLHESLYAFILRSIGGSYRSAWNIERKRLKRKKLSFISAQNRMLLYTLAQMALVVFVYFSFGAMSTLLYLLAATFGIILLETINYIEHYGLRRSKVSQHRYEDAGPEHSWNSDHVMGRLLLFELSRHSDHHAYPERKYQVLRHHDESPQMPTGYPGMMVISAIPPLWFKVMDPRVKALQEEHN